MQRRRFVTAVATVGAVGLAGCSSALGGNDPDGVVEDFYVAFDDGDAEAMNELIHEDAPEGEVTEEDVQDMDEIDVTVEETEILEEDDDVAKVRVEVTMEGELFGEEFDETDEGTVELRTEDDEWKVYDFEE